MVAQWIDEIIRETERYGERSSKGHRAPHGSIPQCLSSSLWGSLARFA
jgi:hypothetical protein